MFFRKARIKVALDTIDEKNMSDLRDLKNQVKKLTDIIRCFRVPEKTVYVIAGKGLRKYTLEIFLV